MPNVKTDSKTQTPAEAPAESTAIQTTPQNTAMVEATDAELAEFGNEGREDITRDDVLIPRLALAQALSPQVTEGHAKLIPGLKAGDLFNSMTGENYGREVYVQIIRKEPLRAMEWNSIDDGGGIKDPNVPLNDPRLKWKDDGGKPDAVLYRDYLARLLPSGELIALSFKSSGIKVAKKLNGLIVLRGANKAIYTGKYKITTGVEMVPKPHKIYLVENAGNVSLADAREGKKMYDALKDLQTAVHQDDPNDDPDAFVPEAMDGGPRM